MSAQVSGERHDELHFARAACSDDLDRAAGIWARAACAREGDSEVPGLELTRPQIDEVLSASPRAFVLLARVGGGDAVGMAAVKPAQDSEDTALLRYFATEPPHWGQAVGSRLLSAVCEAIAEAGFDSASLMVYTTNSRAIELYERCGWRRRGDPQPNPRTGKPMHEYRIALA